MLNWRLETGANSIQSVFIETECVKSIHKIWKLEIGANPIQYSFEQTVLRILIHF